MPLSLPVVRLQRSHGRDQGSHEGHCLFRRRRKKQRHLIRLRIRRTLSLVKNVAGKVTSAGCHVGTQRAVEQRGLGGSGLGKLLEHSACLLIGSGSFQGSDVTKQLLAGSYRGALQLRGRGRHSPLPGVGGRDCPLT